MKKLNLKKTLITAVTTVALASAVFIPLMYCGPNSSGSTTTMPPTSTTSNQYAYIPTISINATNITDTSITGSVNINGSLTNTSNWKFTLYNPDGTTFKTIDAPTSTTNTWYTGTITGLTADTTYTAQVTYTYTDPTTSVKTTYSSSSQITTTSGASENVNLPTVIIDATNVTSASISGDINIDGSIANTSDWAFTLYNPDGTTKFSSTPSISTGDPTWYVNTITDLEPNTTYTAQVSYNYTNPATGDVLPFSTSVQITTSDATTTQDNNVPFVNISATGVTNDSITGSVNIIGSTTDTSNWTGTLSDSTGELGSTQPITIDPGDPTWFTGTINGLSPDTTYTAQVSYDYTDPTTGGDPISYSTSAQITTNAEDAYMPKITITPTNVTNTSISGDVNIIGSIANTTNWELDVYNTNLNDPNPIVCGPKDLTSNDPTSYNGTIPGLTEGTHYILQASYTYTNPTTTISTQYMTTTQVTTTSVKPSNPTPTVTITSTNVTDTTITGTVNISGTAENTSDWAFNLYDSSDMSLAWPAPTVTVDSSSPTLYTNTITGLTADTTYIAEVSYNYTDPATGTVLPYSTSTQISTLSYQTQSQLISASANTILQFNNLGTQTGGTATITGFYLPTKPSIVKNIGLYSQGGSAYSLSSSTYTSTDSTGAYDFSYTSSEPWVLCVQLNQSININDYQNAFITWNYYQKPYDNDPSAEQVITTFNYVDQTNTSDPNVQKINANFGIYSNQIMFETTGSGDLYIPYSTFHRDNSNDIIGPLPFTPWNGQGTLSITYDELQ